MLHPHARAGPALASAASGSPHRPRGTPPHEEAEDPASRLNRHPLGPPAAQPPFAGSRRGDAAKTPAGGVSPQPMGSVHLPPRHLLSVTLGRGADGLRKARGVGPLGRSGGGGRGARWFTSRTVSRGDGYGAAGRRGPGPESWPRPPRPPGLPASAPCGRAGGEVARASARRRSCLRRWARAPGPWWPGPGVLVERPVWVSRKWTVVRGVCVRH